jgi:HD-GYP domain-containing protein (c-di-GMP phosphodiesterase class II)
MSRSALKRPAEPKEISERVSSQDRQRSLGRLRSTQKKKPKQIISEMKELDRDLSSLLAQMKEKVRQLECLTQFSALLNSTLDTQTIREKALQATCELLVCETASLFLVDREKGDLYFETALGDAGQTLQKLFRLPINNQSIAGYVAMTGESLLINDVERDPRYFKKAKSKTAFKTNTMLCIALKSKDQVIGVLQAINKLPSPVPRKSRYSWEAFNSEDMRMAETLAHQVTIAVENAQLYEELKQSFYDTVEALAEAIEKKDRYTGGHTKRVVHFSMCIAKYLELSEPELDQIRLGAILHDVGKIGIEDKILKKAAPLDPYEWPIMKEHPELGYHIMKRVKGLRDVIPAMRYHHERWDGKGYPLGLKGNEIPLIAQIVAVADTYDAMVSTRPYRKGLSPMIAHDEIVRHSGSQFSPQVVEAFQKAFQHERMGQNLD